MPDLLQESAPYALEPAELSAFRNLLLFQNTDISTRPLSTDDIWLFFEWIDRLSYGYSGATNVRHKAYYDELFAALCKEDTPDIYIAHKFYPYAQRTSEWFWDCDLYLDDQTHSDYWKAYTRGHYFYGRRCGGDVGPELMLPHVPQQWRDQLHSTVARWDTNFPKEYMVTRIHPNGELDFQHAYKDLFAFPAVRDHIAILWELQLRDLHAMRNQDELDNRAFFFLLHLLIGLGSGGEATTEYVKALCDYKTDTESHPNDTFINQLTYLALMYLGDVDEPGGKYRLNKDKRIALFNELKSITQSPNPGSRAIHESIGRQLALMDTVDSYPMLDKESNLPLAERKSMTRNALIKALKKVPF